MDQIFNNISNHTALISEINESIHKYTIIHPNLKCIVIIQNTAESVTYSNISTTETASLLYDKSKSHISTTATTSNFY